MQNFYSHIIQHFFVQMFVVVLFEMSRKYRYVRYAIHSVRK